MRSSSHSLDCAAGPATSATAQARRAVAARS